jgi:ABC-type polysaccharide/polyol phosphate export permease
MLPWYAYLVTLGLCLAVLVIGIIFFRRTQQRMVREFL